MSRDGQGTSYPNMESLSANSCHANQTLGTPTGQKSLPKKLPDNLSFYFSLETVDLNHDDEAAMANHIPGYGDWVPPRSKSALRGRGEAWYKWENGTTTQLTEPGWSWVKPHLELYEEATLMQDHRHKKLWLIPMDAKARNVSERFGQGEDWKSITFVRKEDPDGAVYSWVGYMGGSAQLPVPASLSWEDQLIPDEPYGWRDESGQDFAHSLLQPKRGGGLCGSIPVLLCLAAFSCQEHELSQTLKDSFKYREWIRHDRFHDRYWGKGKVVNLFSDPWNPAMNKKIFIDIGQGNYGPVFV